MDAEQLRQQLAEAQDSVTKQGDTVRSLKASLKDGQADKVLALKTLGMEGRVWILNTCLTPLFWCLRPMWTMRYRS
jgi:hypothetical protein